MDSPVRGLIPRHPRTLYLIPIEMPMGKFPNISPISIMPFMETTLSSTNLAA